MSIIQRIHDKAAWLIFIVIGIALVAFLVQDGFKQNGRSINTTIGSVNGKKIEVTEYEQKIKQMEDQYQQMGYPMNDMMRQSVRENAWNQIISERNISEEVDKLGLNVTPKELDDMLFGPNAPEEFKKQFTNEQGIYDVNAAKNAIAQLRKQKTTMADNFNNVYLPALVSNRLHEKFVSLLSNTTYYPKWMLEKMNTDNNSLAAVSYVAVPYSTITDSSKITDDEVAAYVNKHKEEFKQEDNRAIAYVSFDASPSSADTAELVKNLQELKKEMAATPEADINTFLAKTGSQISYMDAYISKTAIQVPNKDSIMALPKGGVFGPYQDAGNLTVAKKIDEKVLPDSVKARHILIATVDPRSGQPLLPDSIAEKKIDSIKKAIDGGARFDSLAAKYSASPEGQTNGGDLGYFAAGKMVKEFNDFCVNGKKGEKKIVKTQFGYHYVEIEDQKNFNPAYKIAYLSKTIVASTETGDNASGLASQFASESRNAKAFDENARKRNYTKLIATEIKPNDITIQPLGSSRQMVRWIYDASIGEVSDVFPVDNKFVVAVLTEINKEGIASPAKARPMVEYIIRNQKKAELIKKKIGSASTLEAVASATGQPVLKADSLSFAAPLFPNAGQEGKIGGYVFNAAAKGKVSAALIGNSGVYTVRPENVYAKQSNGGLDQQKASMIQNARAAASRGTIEAALKKASDIKDTRSKIF